ncbi:MAG: glycerol kinase GlpK [Oscillospiraceae bacterium]|nr:glycerol kinase GlpK [Oscillospiraceae bacterium]
MKQYVAALDQGTTSSRCILFDREQNIVGLSQKEFAQHYPRPGWVEHDPMEIYSSQYAVFSEVLAKTGIDPADIAGIGITNQRETTILWDRTTGRPVYNAIVWQCRRTAALCEELKQDAAFVDYVREHTGLLVDAYFSATKIKWVLDNVPGVRELADQGKLLFGTVDTWLIWKLTGGRVHVTDYTNASRTMLYDIGALRWDEVICRRLGIPMHILPEVRSCSEVYGTLNLHGVEVPISGIAGDQQAALFGQTCFRAGDAKNTYGTGCFLLMNTGSQRFQSRNGLLTTIAVGLDGEVQYALEGSVFIGGAVIQWLRDELHLIHDAADTEYFARKAKDNGGVYVVPAFTGLGAPHWDMYARGAILGLTRGAGRNHIILAALESIAYQSADVLRAMEEDTGMCLSVLRADGGASANSFLMQFQADIMDRTIVRPMIRETTALGAAYLAGLATGLWRDRDDIRSQWTLDRRYTPAMDPAERSRLLRGWSRAVERAKHWAD